MCHALTFLYASGRFRTLRVVKHTPRVAAWRAVRATHLLVQVVRHKTKLPVRQRNFGCPMLRWSGTLDSFIWNTSVGTRLVTDRPVVVVDVQNNKNIFIQESR